jgi:hypothetical protein
MCRKSPQKKFEKILQGLVQGPCFVRPPHDDGGMEKNPAVVQAEEAVEAAVAAFMAALAGSECSGSGAAGGPGAAVGPDAAAGSDDDPLQRVADRALDVLAVVGRSEAKMAAVKAEAVAVLLRPLRF